MRCFFSVLLLFIVFAAPAKAQQPDIVSEPICFQVRNSENFTMYGTIGTNYYTDPRGVQARHRSNFRLEAAGTIDEEGYPADRAEFCSYGPFFEGRKLELTIRTLFPVFSCITRLDQGEIILRAERNASDSGYNYFADCFE